MTAKATVTVLGAGSAYPSGALLWELPPVDLTPTRGRVLRATPTEDVEASAALFFVDEGMDFNSGPAESVNFARLFNRPTVIQATTISGRQLWERQFNDKLLLHAAADNHGGLVLVLDHSYASATPLPQRVQRLDGATGRVTWEYFSDDGSLTEVAIHPDGTVYTVQEDYHTAESHLVSINADTGAVTKRRLPWQHYRPYSTGPIITEDGSVVLVSNPHETGCALHLITLPITFFSIAPTQQTNDPSVPTQIWRYQGPDARTNAYKWASGIWQHQPPD